MALAVAVLSRLLSLFVCFELSGLDRGMTEALVWAGQLEAHSDDCESDASHDCPPGCAACHCSASVALPAEPRASALLELLPVDSTLAASEDARVPAAPPLPGLYRPPRA